MDGGSIPPGSTTYPMGQGKLRRLLDKLWPPKKPGYRRDWQAHIVWGERCLGLAVFLFLFFSFLNSCSPKSFGAERPNAARTLP